MQRGRTMAAHANKNGNTMSALPRIDKLEIQSPLGRGAMGVVYKAYDPFMDRTVAVKMLRTDVLDSAEREDFLRRFRGEAKAYGRLLHPNIVTCYSYNETDGQAYIVMEYVDGKSLKEHLDRNTRFSLPQVREIMLQLLSALAYSHAHGVIHRDIKPANVLLTSEGRIKVTDFGIARVEAAVATTHTKHVVGSPSYMSPEQFSGKSVDARTDIYSAGLVLYELLTGERPFPNSDLGTALYNVLYSEPEAPSRRNAEVSAPLDQTVLKALQKDPNQRYRTAEAFFEDLERCLAPRPAEREHIHAEPDNDETRVISERHLHDTMQVTQHRKFMSDDDAEAVNAASLHAPPLAAVAPAPPPVTRKRRTRVSAVLGLTGVAAALVWLASSDPLALFDSQVVDGTDEQARVHDTAIFTDTPVATDAPTPAPTPARSDQPRPAAAATSSALPPNATLDQQAIMAALQNLSCANVAATASGRDVVLSGFVAAQDDVVKAQRLVAQVPGVQRVTADVRVVAWPYCDLLGLLHPLRGVAPGVPVLPEEEQVMRFREGDALALELKTPPYAAYMYVDYFLLDGQVVHLLPNELEKQNQLPPGERTRIGEPGPGKRHWEVSPPFGREMITIVASREPLSLGDRPEVESAKDYLSAMQTALSNAGDKQVTANYTFIETQPRDAK